MPTLPNISRALRAATVAAILTAAAAATAAEPAGQQSPPPIDFNSLDCRWTFGNHEPISMYRRVGRHCTGGIEGGAQWLPEWHRWYDSEESVKIMQRLGLNMLHSRFYKGMGWEFESRDFPNVQRFVRNCHKHGVRALAYVQFSTLYYETMLAEVPGLADWAAVDSQGRKRTYHGASYFRWLPCINAPGFEPYLKKVIRIALVDGDFDGIMFDNCFMPPCYCERCTKLFRRHLAEEPDPVGRFGIASVDHVLLPVHSGYGEAQDPIYQQWLRFRCQRMTDLFERLYRHAKSCKPSAIVSGNVANIRRSNMAGSAALKITDLDKSFDIFVSQSGNEPGMRGNYLVNRVREMKLARALGTPILALSDSDAGISDEAESKYVLNLMENAAFGGIPTDRTVMKPDKEEMVSRRLIEFRAPLLERFNKTIQTHRASFERPSYAPVLLLYSAESVMFSEQAFKALLSAEEILLRNHIPYGLLPTDADKKLEVPDDCQLLLVCDQPCLTDAQLASLVRYAEADRPLIVTGRAGEYDEHYRQRRTNPLAALDGRKTVVRREAVDLVPIPSSGWTHKITMPAGTDRQLLADLDKIWRPAIRIEAPATVLAEIKRDGPRLSIHLVNYSPKPVPAGARVLIRSGAKIAPQCTFAAPMEGRAAAPLATASRENGTREAKLPTFTDYGLVEFAGPQE